MQNSDRKRKYKNQGIIFICLAGISFLLATAFFLYGKYEEWKGQKSVEALLTSFYENEMPNFELENKPVREIQKGDTIGILSIPKLSLELPVLYRWSEELIKKSVATFSGEVTGDFSRLVILGHNYESHFGKLPNLKVGDAVMMKWLEGIEYQYEVTELLQIQGTDAKSLQEGDWDLTLFTCNFDGTKRELVRCKRIDE